MHQSMKYPVSTGIYWPLWNWLVQIIIPPTLKYIMMHRGITTINRETSLLRKLQGRPSPAEAPPISKIHPFSKIAITFEPLMGF